jgi:FAD/FMN-containing dehydrogenase
VIEFEVVLADGTIVTASSAQNSDLFRALKGGGSNFGIVTRFVLSTFALGEIWTRDVVYSSSAIDEMAPALNKFVATSHKDAKASALVTYHFTAGSPAIIAAQYIYAEPEVSATSVFDDLFAVPDQLLNSTGSTTLPAYSVVHGSQSPTGYQYVFPLQRRRLPPD